MVDRVALFLQCRLISKLLFCPKRMAQLAKILKGKNIRLADPFEEHNRRVQFVEQNSIPKDVEADSVTSSAPSELYSPTSVGSSIATTSPAPTPFPMATRKASTLSILKPSSLKIEGPVSTIQGTLCCLLRMGCLAELLFK